MFYHDHYMPPPPPWREGIIAVDFSILQSIPKTSGQLSETIHGRLLKLVKHVILENPLITFALFQYYREGGEIAQSLSSLSTEPAIRVRARHDPLVIERWNSITVLLTRSHQCRRMVKKRPSMCYYVCVIMHVKDP